MKTYICEKCGKETLHYLARYILDPNDKMIIKDKKLYCPEHYGQYMAPVSYVAFDALHILGWWASLIQNVWWGFEDSKKIYKCSSKYNDRPWAYAIVVNGDYQDIKEGHVASWLRDGHVPTKITLDQLIDDVKNSCNNKTVSKYMLNHLTREFPDLTKILNIALRED